MDVICQACNSQAKYDPSQYRCACGHPWEPDCVIRFDEKKIEQSRYQVQRYAAFFGEDDFDWTVSLGAGWTPLIRTKWQEDDVYFKLEYISPTASFKDRGTEVEAAFLKLAGVTQIVEDSSGNAGASIAAYTANAGIKAKIFAPSSAPQAKLDQIRLFGAEMHAIPGARIEATRAALDAVENGAIYASHAYNPVYLLGQYTFAWEVWEQTTGHLPDAIIIPVGQGGLFLGAYLGFRHLLQSGVISHLPRLFAVQPAVFAPLYPAFSEGCEHVSQIDAAGKSIADGVAIGNPIRGDRILEGLRKSSGGVVTVSEQQIKKAYFSLAAKGLFVEPTSAIAAAAIPAVKRFLQPGARIIVALTGSGLKTPFLIQ